MMDDVKEAARSQDHWTVVGAIKAARSLIKAADDLSFAAQITGCTAGRDDALCAAIVQWAAERDKQKQVLRIIELEGDDPAIGVGFELCPSALTTASAEAEGLRERVKELESWKAAEDAHHHRLRAEIASRDAIIHQLGENAAKAAREYAERVAVLEGALRKIASGCTVTVEDVQSRTVRWMQDTARATLQGGAE